MAQMLPEFIQAKASQGEKKLFAVLRDRLPDDFIVWYEPQVKGLHPDFIVLGPNFGLLVIEVRHPQQSWWLDECDRPQGVTAKLEIRQNAG
jgi:hypothetical protein